MAPTYERFVEVLNRRCDRHPHRLESEDALALGVMRELGTSGPYARKLLSEAVAKEDAVRVRVDESGFLYGIGKSGSAMLYLRLDDRWHGQAEYGGAVTAERPKNVGALWSGGTRYLYTSQAGYVRLKWLYEETAERDSREQKLKREAERARSAAFLAEADPRAAETLAHLRKLGARVYLIADEGEDGVSLHISTGSAEEAKAMLRLLVRALPENA